ncbi:alpha/beta fold hydrolase [Patescibacteria group bacterium]
MTPILIIRGWESRIKNWQKLIILLENHGYKVYSPDLPGFGQNPPPQNPWSIDDYVGWVSDFCEKNNLSQIFLLGHSFGGGVAVKYSIKYPDKIRKLILVGSAIVRRKTGHKKPIGKVARWIKKISFMPFYPFIRKFAYRFVFKSDYPFEEGIMKETYLKVISENLIGYLFQINTPTLIVWGKKDDLTPVKDANLIKEKIRGADLKILPEIGHNLHSEIPGKFADIIINFIKKS